MRLHGYELTNLYIIGGQYRNSSVIADRSQAGKSDPVWPSGQNQNGRKITMKDIEQRTYSIGEAGRLCGVTEKQIRHWEAKNHIPTAPRVICGERSYRQYGEEDLELIRRIKGYLDEGFTLSAAAKRAAGLDLPISES